MEIFKANLQNFNHRLEFHWVSLVPTVFRRVFRSICVGFLPLEKSPGGFCSQATFRVRFPKPPWNLFYTTILPVIDYCGPVSITAYGDTNRIPLTIQHALNSTGIALIHVPAGVKDARDTKIILDMLFWALDNPAPANFMLISGDRDFFNALHGKVWMQYGHDDTLSFSWSKNSTSSAIALGFGLIKVQILSDDDDDVYRSWVITFSSLDMIHRCSQSHVIFIHLFFLWYKHEVRSELHVSCDWFYCFVRANRIQKMRVCLILYSSEIHWCSSCFYQDNILLNILLSTFWWHWGHSSWQQWVTERLPHKLSEYLPESSNILMSTKRQDPGSSPTTLLSHFLSKVMQKAFWSFSSKLIANNKYVKEGHNKLFHLLAWQTSERIA